MVSGSVVDVAAAGAAPVVVTVVMAVSWLVQMERGSMEQRESAKGGFVSEEVPTANLLHFSS